MSHDPTPVEAQDRWHAVLQEAGVAMPLGTERLAVGTATGRVTARAIAALRPSPPLRVAAMDGIAVRASDTAQAPVVLAAEAFAPVDTGAPMPAGFDAVVMREHVTLPAATSGRSVRTSRSTRPSWQQGIACARSMWPCSLLRATPSSTSCVSLSSR